MSQLDGNIVLIALPTIVRQLPGTTALDALWATNVAIIPDACPATERGQAIGLNLVAGVSGSVIGLILGGILTVSLGWQSICWINLPIGAFATFWAHLKLRELGTFKHEKIDPAVTALCAGGLSLFLVGLTLGALE